MVQQGKHTITCQRSTVVGLFLPSMDGCKISFMKAILCDDKKALKAKDVHPIEIPNYPEISVKSLYDDAMNDPEVAQYLPSKKQVSNKLPERQFFFGVLSSLRHDYVQEVVRDAHERRFKLPEDDQKKQGILISDSWLEELKKHPYFSSNIVC
jgi:hypothetical protein